MYYLASRDVDDSLDLMDDISKLSKPIGLNQEMDDLLATLEGLEPWKLEKEPLSDPIADALDELPGLR